jgi:hypothetical protein
MASRSEWWRVVVGLVIFGVAFGYVEAAVVAYLRAMYAPLRAQFYPSAPSGELFPLLTLDQLSLVGPEHATRLKIELGRECATLAVLASVAVIPARKAREWIAAFAVCFGIWDVAFYLWLKLLLAWPASLFTWDILFLLPVPWVGPVIAPILVSISMIGAGLVVLWREYNDKPVHIAASRWAVIITGGAVVLAAFMWDFRNTAMGGSPNPFNWELFFLGEVMGLLAFATALRSR